METITTQNVAIPRLGLGTFRLTGADCQSAVEGAISLGYRHLDTATMYGNEAEVGAAIKASGVQRSDLFVTTKVWRDQLAPNAIRASLDASLRKLKLDYVDLFMVHWPSPDMDMAAVLATMVRLREEKKIRAIGVCNFNRTLMRQAVEEIQAPVAVLQIEYHPFLDQSAMLAYARRHGVGLTAYAPLAQGRAASDGTLEAIGARHGASAAQIAIAWLLDQKGVIAIPKAGRRASQQSNLEALNIVLNDDDRAAIAALPKDLRYVQPAAAPDWDA